MLLSLHPLAESKVVAAAVVAPKSLLSRLVRLGLNHFQGRQEYTTIVETWNITLYVHPAVVGIQGLEWLRCPTIVGFWFLRVKPLD